eukprot:g7660.t1
MLWAHVTTVSNGVHQASKEPERVNVTVDPKAALGISFAVGGIVRQVAPKGQVAALGVREGWRLTDIGGGGRKAADTFRVTAASTSKEVLEALAAARKRGKPYALGFLATTSSAGKPTDLGKEEQGQERGETAGREPDGCGSGDAGTGVEQQSGNDAKTRNDLETSEGKGRGEEQESAPAVGNDSSPGNHVVEDGAGGGGGGGGGGAKEEASQEGEAVVGNGDGEDGCVTSAEIDETYCLSFVMPNCTLHLGPVSPADRYAQESNGEVVPYLQEGPPGTFHGLVDGGVYWVYVSRDDEQENQDRERMKQVVQGMQEDLPDGGAERKDDGRNGLESCSCIYGNPCVDEYGCKDWHSRYAVAKANGWKGF